ncbi:MAG: serine/threonine protein kinase, partial [Labilithrix sp.]|nr:serine/threonine protein kinase [Labilithrix sp.]
AREAAERRAQAAPTLPPQASDRTEPQAGRGRGRGLLLIALCFAIGAVIAAGAAWKMGKIGGGSDETDERYVARATDAMYKNHFLNPPGDNVREITDEGLKKWPNDAKLVDVRVRAANVLVSQAMVQRTSGDVLEALRLARAAHELDPNDPSAKRLVEQYEGELAASTTPTATPLTKPAAAPPSSWVKPVGPATGAAPAASTAATAGAYKITLEANAPQPRLGQTVTFTSHVTPPRGTFESPVFTISGPGVPGGVTMAAQSPATGVFTVSYAFLEAGRFDVVFTVQIDGKPQKAGRTLVAGDGAPKLPDPATKPSASAPAAAPSSSVKWM